MSWGGISLTIMVTSLVWRRVYKSQKTLTLAKRVQPLSSEISSRHLHSHDLRRCSTTSVEVATAAVKVKDHQERHRRLTADEEGGVGFHYTAVYDHRRCHQGLVTIGMHPTSSCHQEEKVVTGKDREATKGTMRTSGEAGKSWNVAVTSRKLPLLRFVAATPP
ncbi:unnamed protein product [Lactuca saligna]|uniref:Uncharacterized protein n=1 Tax=Lactuca saligna TaxID=75948 RepID=A0AA35YAG2_LACSI|nr:unnamed protein product [Lactuca saligna]